MIVSIQDGVTTLKDVMDSISHRLRARYFKKDVNFDVNDDFFELYRCKKTLKGARSEEARKVRSIEEIGINDSLYVILDEVKKFDCFDDMLCNHPTVIDDEDNNDTVETSSEVDLFKCLNKFVSEEILGEADMWVSSIIFMSIFLQKKYLVKYI